MRTIVASALLAMIGLGVAPSAVAAQTAETPIPAGQFGAGAYRVDQRSPDVFKLPAVKTRAVPRYTPAAVAQQLSGNVDLEFIVQADGTVGDVRVLRGLDAGLDQNAIACVKAWTFTPGTLAGHPVPMLQTMSLSFVARDAASWMESPVQVYGEVQRPGPVRSNKPLTALSALALAGGATPAAVHVDIRHRSSGTGPLTLMTPASEYRVTRLALGELTAGTIPDPALADGDLIVVTKDSGSPRVTSRPDLPDLNGAWVLVSQTQPNALPAALTITQDAGTMKVAGGRDTWTYRLDGSASENPMTSVRGDLIQRTCRANWMTAALLVTMTTSGPSGTWSDIYTYAIDAAGQLVVVNVTPLLYPNGAMATNVAIYKRG